VFCASKEFSKAVGCEENQAKAKMIDSLDAQLQTLKWQQIAKAADV